MFKFAKVKPSFWRRRDLRGVGSLTRLLAIYLLTNENFRMVGIYRLTKYTMMKELAIDSDQLEVAMGELVNRGFCRYDDDDEVVWVVDMALSQVADNPNETQLKGIQNELKGLAEADFPFLPEFAQKYEDVFKVCLE